MNDKFEILRETGKGIFVVEKNENSISRFLKDLKSIFPNQNFRWREQEEDEFKGTEEDYIKEIIKDIKESYQVSDLLAIEVKFRDEYKYNHLSYWGQPRHNFMVDMRETKNSNNKGENKMSKIIKETKSQTIRGAERIGTRSAVDLLIERIKESINNEQINAILDSPLGKQLAPILLLKGIGYITEDKGDKTSRKVNKFCRLGSEEYIQQLLETLLPEATIAKAAIAAAADYLDDDDDLE